MENNFKDIEPLAVLPDRVKQETLAQLEAIKLLMGMVDLFTSKAGSTISASLSGSVELPSLPPGEQPPFPTDEADASPED
ncbi:MAG: hypothetical protein AAF824_22465 [Bacteroidota bacterium]